MFQKELEKIRLYPINCIAAQKLRQQGIDVSENMMPLFQLMNWGLTMGLCRSQAQTVQELLRIQYQEPQIAFDFLLEKVPGGLYAFQKRMMTLPPRKVAEELLALLDMRLKSAPDKT